MTLWDRNRLAADATIFGTSLDADADADTPDEDVSDSDTTCRPPPADGIHATWQFVLDFVSFLVIVSA